MPVHYNHVLEELNALEIGSNQNSKNLIFMFNHSLDVKFQSSKSDNEHDLQT